MRLFCYNIVRPKRWVGFNFFISIYLECFIDICFKCIGKIRFGFLCRNTSWNIGVKKCGTFFLQVFVFAKLCTSEFWHWLGLIFKLYHHLSFFALIVKPNMYPYLMNECSNEWQGPDLKINPNQCQNHLKLIYSSMPKQFHNIGPLSNMIKCIINDANLFFSSIERQNDVDTLDVIEVRRIQKTKSEKQSLNYIK